MLLRPLRRAPMMLGGVGFQAGLDEAHRKQVADRRKQAAAQVQAQPTPAGDVVTQLKDLKVLLDDGALSPEEFQLVKRGLLDAMAAGDDRANPTTPAAAEQITR